MADDYYNDPILDYGTLLLNFGGQIANVAAQKDAQRMKLMEYGVQAERQQLDDMIQISNYRAKQAAERVDQLTAQNVNNNIQSMLKNSQPGGNQGAALMTMFALKDMEGTQGFKRLMEKYPNLDEHYNTAMRHVLTPTGSGPGAAPDWSNILANRGKDGEFAKPAAYEDVMKVSMQTPPEQRPALWQALGYPLQAIQYDRATGLPTTTPDQLPDYMRAALMSRNEGIPFNDVVMTKQGAQQIAPGAVPLDDNTLAIPGSLSRVKLQEFGGREGLLAQTAAIDAASEQAPTDAYLMASRMAAMPGLMQRLDEVKAGVAKESPIYQDYAAIDPAKKMSEISAKPVYLDGKETSFAGVMARARTGDQNAVVALLNGSRSDPYVLREALKPFGIAVTDGAIERSVLDRTDTAVATEYSPQTTLVKTLGASTVKELNPSIQKIYQISGTGEKADASWSALREEVYAKLPGSEGVPEEAWSAVANASPKDRPAALANFAVQVRSKVEADVQLQGQNTTGAMNTILAAAGYKPGEFTAFSKSLRGENGPVKKQEALLALNTTEVDGVKAIDTVRNNASLLKDTAGTLAHYAPPQGGNTTATALAVGNLAESWDGAGQSEPMAVRRSGYRDLQDTMRTVVAEADARAATKDGLVNAAPDVAKSLLASLDVAALGGLAKGAEGIDRLGKSIGQSGNKLAAALLGKGKTSADLAVWIAKSPWLMFESTVDTIGSAYDPANQIQIDLSGE